jgi:hypothetical protein
MKPGSILQAITEYKYKYNQSVRLLFGEKCDINLGFDWSQGTKRWKLINQVIQKYNYQSYLEIGCAYDDCFKRVNCSHKVGVDPSIGGTIRKTSDDFFASNKDKFDFIFIDGLHEYHQVKKDILNSLNCLQENGIIMLHDCLPNRIEEQAVPRENGVWNGDVWKAIVELRTYDNLDTAVCLMDCGVGAIKKRKNSDILKFDREINFAKLKFSEYANNYAQWLRTIEYNDMLEFIDSK